MPLSSDCLFSFFFPKQLVPEPRNEKRRPIETSFWRHSSALPQRLLCFRWMTEDYLHSVMHTGGFDVWILTFPSPPFVWLRLRLSLFHQTASRHTEHLALCALHLIFIQKMKVDSMPSSVTPCGNPAEPWLSGCIVGSLDLTRRYHSAEDSNLWFSASLRAPVFYSSSLSSSLKEALQLHPIRSRVPTFILAEFNYLFPFLPALIHPKPWNSFYHFS